MTAAVTRGMLMAVAVAMPALILPGVGADTSQITVLVALIAAGLTFAEYVATAPTIVEFRDAKPFNRIRFISLFMTLLFISFILRDHSETAAMTGVVASLGKIIGHTLDFPFSPVRLVVLSAPIGTPLQELSTLRAAAGIAYVTSLVTVGYFAVLVWWRGWPTRNGPFNVWVNFPLFDPTRGGDVLNRLQMHARFNVVAGFLLPFIAPAVVKASGGLLDPWNVQNTQTMTWMLSAWAFLPICLIMRGIAMYRVADLIANKRRRTYATRDQSGLQTA